MIDLHIHTTYSDGTDNLKKLLINAEKTKLEVISITDHNTCESYKKMEKLNINKFYQGNIIVGCEFTTSFDNRLIEVLGYGFDYQKVQNHLDNYYTKEKINKDTTILFNRLIEKINDLGLKYNKKNIQKIKFNKKFFERKFYDELVKYPENKEKLEEAIWESFSNFYRKGLTNPNSKMFINAASLKPSLKEIIDVVHDSNGLIFLAHPYQYKFDDTEDFLDKIYNNFNFDGIECFYTTFSEKQTNYLINFARMRNILISGGSDYHGNHKQEHDLGVGRGNLNISKIIIENWSIKMYK